MPYMLEGKCVYKKNPDGSKGESKGCSESVEMAKKHMAALYAAENKSVVELSMEIRKASIPDKANRTMRLSMINSDVSEDAYGERMSVELFEDFVERIENNEPVPEPFDDVVCEDGWCGGLPYLSVSHYKSGGGANVPGEVEKVYLDGERLKSTAVLYDTPLGQRVWKSVCDDIECRGRPLEERKYKDPVRVSIGFIDLQHKHVLEGEEDFIFTRTALKQVCPKCDDGVGGKVYLKGQLVHKAFTRVPANKNTSVEVLRMSDEIETKKADAESIIGDLADGLVGKSTVEDDGLVVKATEEESRDQKKKKEEDEMEEEKSQAVPENLEVTMEENQVQEPVQEEIPATPAPVAKSKVDEATENFRAKMLELKSKGVTGDAAIQQLQPYFSEMGKAAKEEFASPMDGVAEVVRSAVAEAVGGLKAEIVAEVLKAIPAQANVTKAQETPQPRSLLVNRTTAPQQQRELTEIEKIALRSVTGQQM